MGVVRSVASGLAVMATALVLVGCQANNRPTTSAPPKKASLSANGGQYYYSPAASCQVSDVAVSQQGTKALFAVTTAPANKGGSCPIDHIAIDTATQTASFAQQEDAVTQRRSSIDRSGKVEDTPNGLLAYALDSNVISIATAPDVVTLVGGRVGVTENLLAWAPSALLGRFTSAAEVMAALDKLDKARRQQPDDGSAFDSLKIVLAKVATGREVVPLLAKSASTADLHKIAMTYLDFSDPQMTVFLHACSKAGRNDVLSTPNRALFQRLSAFEPKAAASAPYFAGTGGIEGAPRKAFVGTVLAAQRSAPVSADDRKAMMALDIAGDADHAKKFQMSCSPTSTGTPEHDGSDVRTKLTYECKVSHQSGAPVRGTAKVYYTVFNVLNVDGRTNERQVDHVLQRPSFDVSSQTVTFDGSEAKFRFTVESLLARSWRISDINSASSPFHRRPLGEYTVDAVKIYFGGAYFNGTAFKGSSYDIREQNRLALAHDTTSLVSKGKWLDKVQSYRYAAEKKSMDGYAGASVREIQLIKTTVENGVTHRSFNCRYTDGSSTVGTLYRDKKDFVCGDKVGCVYQGDMDALMRKVCALKKE